MNIKKNNDVINIFNMIFIDMLLKKAGIEDLTSKEAIEIINHIERNSTIPEVSSYARFFKEAMKEMKENPLIRDILKK